MVIGDFNLNPFEDAMVGADGFNAVMDARHLERAARTIKGASWSSFYNPMWSLLGDKSPGAPGSHYYASSDIISYYWNMFDQIIFREPLLKYFSGDCIRLIDAVGPCSILNGSKLNITIADHLPLSVSLAIEGDPNG